MTPGSDLSVAAPAMLVAFRGRNIRSFQDDFELSLQATPLAEREVVRRVEWRDGPSPKNEMEILPAAAIFGSNASGKSNVLRAMSDMRDAVLGSFRLWPPGGSTRRSQFRLGPNHESTPSSYEIDLILGGVLHNYGFELDDTRILREWAYRFPRGRAQAIFQREGDDIRLGSSASTALRAAVGAVRDNALLLSTSVAFKGGDLRPLYDWFQRNLLLAEAISRPVRQVFTAHLLDDEGRRSRVLALLQAADLGIVDVRQVELDADKREQLEQIVRILIEGNEVQADAADFVSDTIELVHQGADGPVHFDLEEESLGTLVWLGLVGPIVDALENGLVLLVDELDASLHPNLVTELVRLFQNPITNPRRAQLIFNAHEASLMGDASGARALGRDQIWFAEKLSSGASRLYSLTDMNPRREEAVGRRYISGRYGAVPLLSSGDFEDAVVAEPVASR